jgi:hypothetical protein
MNQIVTLFKKLNLKILISSLLIANIFLFRVPVIAWVMYMTYSSGGFINPQNNFYITDLLFRILIGPIMEEFIYRYWLRSKRNVNSYEDIAFRLFWGYQILSFLYYTFTIYSVFIKGRLNILNIQIFPNIVVTVSIVFLSCFLGTITTHYTITNFKKLKVKFQSQDNTSFWLWLSGLSFYLGHIKIQAGFYDLATLLVPPFLSVLQLIVCYYFYGRLLTLKYHIFSNMTVGWSLIHFGSKVIWFDIFNLFYFTIYIVLGVSIFIDLIRKPILPTRNKIIYD